MRAGTLVVDIAANVARLQQDMAQAKGVVQGAMNDISRSVSVAKGALASLGVGLGVGALASMAAEIVKATAALDDMAEVTGTTVENLSRFSVVAKIGSHDMSLIEDSLVKLTKGLKGTDEETSNAAAALQYLGVQAKDSAGKLRDPGEIMREVAGKLAEFKDGAGKTAIALDLFGKSGAKLLPFLKDMAEEGSVAARVTAEQAAQAEVLEKNLKRLQIAGDDAKREFMSGITPGMVDFTQKLLDAQKAAGNLATALLLVAAGGKSISQVNSEISEIENRSGVEKWARNGLTMGLAGVSDQMTLSLLYRQRDYLQLQQRRAASEVVDPLAMDKPALSYTGRQKVAGAAGGRGDDGAQMILALKDQLAAADHEGSVFESTMRKLTEGTKEFSLETQATALALAGEIDNLKRAAVELKRWQEVTEAAITKQEQLDEQKKTALAGWNAELGKIEFETSLIGLNTAEREKAVMMRQVELEAIKAEMNQAPAEIELIERRAAAMKAALGAAIDAKVAREEAHKASEDAAREWKDAFHRLSNTIEQALTQGIVDALSNGFKKGESFGKNFLTVLENMFKTAVLTPTISAIVSPVANTITAAVASALGMSGSASAAGGGSGGGGGLSLGSLSNLSSLSNLIPGGNPITNAITSALGIGGGAALSGTALAGEVAALTGSAAGAGAVGAAGGLAAGAMSAIPYVGIAFAVLSLMGAFGGGGGPKASDVGLYSDNAGGLHFGQNNVTDTGWGEAYDPQFVQEYRALGPAGKAFMDRYLGAKWGSSGPDSSQNLVSQHIAPLLAQAHALDQQQQSSSLAPLGTQAALVASLQQWQQGMAVSPYLSPMDRLSGAQSLFDDVLARARAGDTSAIQSLGGTASTLLSAGRDVYASGPQFAALMKTVNMEMGDLLTKSQEAANKAFAELPISIQQAGQATVDALNAQTAELSSKLDKLSQDVRALSAAVG